MKKRTKKLFAFCVLSSLGSPARAAPVLSDLHALELHEGINHVERFADDGRAANIFVGWRDNGNAHGYNLYVITMPNEAGQNGWDIMGLQGGDESPLLDVLRDDPHTFEDAVKSVRFVRGLVDGKPATLLMTATRTISFGAADGFYSPAPATYEVFRLGRGRGFSTADVFQRIFIERSRDEFCNEDKALQHRFGLPLPVDYQGGPDRGGCLK